MKFSVANYAFAKSRLITGTDQSQVRFWNKVRSVAWRMFSYFSPSQNHKNKYGLNTAEGLEDNNKLQCLRKSTMLTLTSTQLLARRQYQSH